MSVFVVSRVKIHDPAAIGGYFEAAPATVPAFGGEYQGRTNRIAPLEGDWALNGGAALPRRGAGAGLVRLGRLPPPS